MEFTHSIYDHVIHPQWDSMDSPTLFVKILFVDYDERACIIELIGEWNDCLNNDIMHFKRNILEELMAEGIDKFVLVGDNVLIFHSSDDCYYEEWFDEIDDGWIALVNFNDQALEDMQLVNIDQYVLMDEKLQDIPWRTFNPKSLCTFVNDRMMKRLTI